MNKIINNMNKGNNLLANYACHNEDAIRLEPIERCLNHFGVQNSEAVYVGDSEIDIITALNSDMDSISCTWGYRPRRFLVENGALFICTEPIDLRNIMR